MVQIGRFLLSANSCINRKKHSSRIQTFKFTYLSIVLCIACIIYVLYINGRRSK
jgi:hypothetical protein